MVGDRERNAENTLHHELLGNSQAPLPPSHPPSLPSARPAAFALPDPTPVLSLTHV